MFHDEGEQLLYVVINSVFIIYIDIEFLLPDPDLVLGSISIIMAACNIQHRRFSYKNDVLYAPAGVKISSNIVCYLIDICI